MGLRGGTVPSSEPGFATPPLPSSAWHFTQLASNTALPAVASPCKSTAGPGPPGLDGRAISSVGDGTAVSVAVGAGVSVGAVVGASVGTSVGAAVGVGAAAEPQAATATRNRPD